MAFAPAPHVCWWNTPNHNTYTVAPEPDDVPPLEPIEGHPDIARVQRMTAELRAAQLVTALRNAAEARVGWRQQARDLLFLIDHGILP